MRAACSSGVPGGFTNFSAFALDSTALHALAYVAASVLGSLAAVVVGLWLPRHFA